MQNPTLLLRSTANPSALAGTIRRAVKVVTENLPEPVIQTMDQILAETVAEPRFYTLLSLSFGLTAPNPRGGWSLWGDLLHRGAKDS